MTRSLSNLLKGRNVISSEERVIDYNSLIKSKIDMILSESNQDGSSGFVTGLTADFVEAVEDDDLDESIGINADSDAMTMNLIKKSDFESAATRAESVISDANEEAEKIIAQANSQAEQIRQDAYDKGKMQAMVDMEKEFDQKSQELAAEFQTKKETIENEYNEKKANMEPELVETLLQVFKKVIAAVSQDNEEMIINLINGVMHNTEVSHEFLIKVSPEDYNFVVNNQGKIYCAMSKDIQLEIIEDSSMKKNQCIIESDTGVYDCSLDIQMENLVKDIKLLSCI